MASEIRHLTAADGTRIAYAEEGSGPPLIHVRGWISHLELLWEEPSYRSFMDTLATRFRVIRYDARGNGLSDDPGPVESLQDLVVDLESLVDHLGLREVTLYGTAFGGPIAAWFAADHPDRVARLVLSGTFARGSEITSRARRRFLTAALRFFPEMAFLLLGYATNPDAPGAAYRRPDRIGRLIAPRTAARLYELAFKADVSDVLRRVTAPTLVLHRRDSQSIPLRLGREVAELIPSARLQVIGGVAHNDWEGGSDEALSAMAEFLEVDLGPGGVEEPKARAVPEEAARYAIVERISEGPNSTVYRGHDHLLDRPVAIKILPSRLSGDADAVARFRREMKAVASLNHPNVCTLHDVQLEPGGTRMVMEMLEGRSLKDVLETGPVAIPSLLAWAADICAGLSAAHESGVIHRDVKPSNVFITASGRAKLLDFGLAKVGRVETSDEAMALTRSDVIVGTPAYMSPEQIRGEGVDARSDLFSLGIVLYQMAVGRLPFDGETVPEILVSIIRQEPTRPTSLDRTLPPALDAILTKALAKDPARRYPSADALARDLETRVAAKPRGPRGWWS